MIDSFTEVISEVNGKFVQTRNIAKTYTDDSRPRMQGFNESPEMIDSGELDEEENPIMVLRSTFTSSVVRGTEIVFLNGLMQLEGDNYSISVVASAVISVGAGGLSLIPPNVSIVFTEAPALTDRVNIYGVVAPNQPAFYVGIGSDGPSQIPLPSGGSSTKSGGQMVGEFPPLVSDED